MVEIEECRKCAKCCGACLFLEIDFSKYPPMKCLIYNNKFRFPILSFSRNPPKDYRIQCILNDIDFLIRKESKFLSLSKEQKESGCYPSNSVCDSYSCENSPNLIWENSYRKPYNKTILLERRKRIEQSRKHISNFYTLVEILNA